MSEQKTAKEEFIEITVAGQATVVIAQSVTQAKSYAVGEQIKAIKAAAKEQIKAAKSGVLARPLSGGEILRGGYTFDNTFDVRTVPVETASEA